jgi:hypothetical protein
MSFCSIGGGEIVANDNSKIHTMLNYYGRITFDNECDPNNENTPLFLLLTLYYINIEISNENLQCLGALNTRYWSRTTHNC